MAHNHMKRLFSFIMCCTMFSVAFHFKNIPIPKKVSNSLLPQLEMVSSDGGLTCAHVYAPLGFVPQRGMHLSITMDPGFQLTYAVLPSTLDILRECVPERFAVCDPWNMESHFSAEHLLALNLRSHPQVNVVDISELAGLSNTTLIFFPLILSILKVAGGSTNNIREREQIDLMKDFMRTNSLANGHEVVRADLWGQTLEENGILLAMHGNVGSSEGIRADFKQGLYASHSRHIIIPYGHLNPELHYPDRNLLLPERNRPFFLFYLGGYRINAIDVRAQVDAGIQELSLIPNLKMSVHVFNSESLRAHMLDVLDATFCPCPRGDSDDTRRIFTAILGGCIPVIASDWIVLPFEGFIDWTQFAIFSNQDQMKDTLIALQHIPTEEIQSRRRALLCVREHFIYHSGGSVVPLDAIDMIMATLSSRSRIMKETSRWFRTHRERANAAE